MNNQVCKKLYLTSIKNYREKYLSRDGKAHEDWKMTDVYRERYKEDSQVKHIRIDFDTMKAAFISQP